MSQQYSLQKRVFGKHLAMFLCVFMLLGYLPGHVFAGRLQVFTVGTGEGRVKGGQIDCGSSCEQVFEEPAEIELSALAGENSDFKGWMINGLPHEGPVLLDQEVVLAAARFDLKKPPAGEDRIHWYKRGFKKGASMALDEVAVFFNPAVRDQLVPESAGEFGFMVQEMVHRVHPGAVVSDWDEHVMFIKSPENIEKEQLLSLLDSLKTFDLVRQASPVFYKIPGFKDSRTAPTGEIIVKFPNHYSNDKISKLESEYGLDRLKPGHKPNSFVYHTNDALASIAVANHLQEAGLTEYAYPNMLLRLSPFGGPPNDFIDIQWKLQAFDHTLPYDGLHSVNDQGSRPVIRRLIEEADELPGDTGPEEHRHLFYGLLFLKTISDTFYAHRERLAGWAEDPDSRFYIEDPGVRAQMMDEILESPGNYTDFHIFWVPPEARWDSLLTMCEDSSPGSHLNEALILLDNENSRLEGIRPPDYTAANVKPRTIRNLMTLASGKEPNSAAYHASVVLGKVYGYYLCYLTLSLADVENKAVLDSMLVSGTVTAPKAVYQEDIVTFGPTHITHPKIKPFYLNPAHKNKQMNPMVTFDGTNYLVVWIQDGSYYENGINKLKRTLMGCRITPLGKILDKGGFAIAEHIAWQYLRVASGKDPKTGNGYSLVVWTVEDKQNIYQVRGAVVTTDGKVLVNLRTDTKEQPLQGKQAANSGGIRIFPSVKDHYPEYTKAGDSFGCYRYPTVTHNGKEFVVTCAYNYASMMAHAIEPSTGKVKVEQPVKKTGKYPMGKPVGFKIDLAKYASTMYDTYDPRITWGGGNEYFITWSHTYKPGVGKLWGMKAVYHGSNWSFGNPTVISDQAAPSYARCEMDSDRAGRYFLAWEDMSWSYKKNWAEVNGKIVQWPNDWPDLFTAGIQTPSGKPVWNYSMVKKPFYVAKGTGYWPKVAFDGNNYIILFNRVFGDLMPAHVKAATGGCYPKAGPGFIYGAYVTQSGKMLDLFKIKAPDNGFSYMADMAFGHNEGVMVYERQPSVKNSDPYKYNIVRVCFFTKSMKYLDVVFP